MLACTLQGPVPVNVQEVGRLRPCPRLLWLALLSLAGACSPANDEGASVAQPPGWDEDIGPVLAEDLNADPNVLEVKIEARLAEIEILPGVRSQVWSYNGSVPGPLLRAKRGDRLIVHFTNHLPEATTVHWHGVRVPSTMDGTHAVQDPVEPGESFTYDFELPDAGTFWYHPHIDSSAQVGYGLYGPIVVEDPDDPVDVDDLVLVLSDMSLDDEGQLKPGDDTEWFGDYFGREGSVLLVNGKVRPKLRARAGLPQRWRVINAARARFFQMDVPGTDLIRIGGDGGLIERPQTFDELLLVTSERAEVLVSFPGSAAGELEVVAQDPDRFGLGVLEPDQPLFDVEVEAGRAGHPRVPDVLREFPPLDLAGLPTRQIVLGEQAFDGVPHLAINGEVHQESMHHHETPHVAYVGDTEVWEVLNDTDYAHPFHLHGFSFEVLEVGGRPWPVRELKDSVNVPPRETLRFVVTYDDRPGLWMFHCHILDHAKLGMMAVLEVRPRE